MTDMNSCLAMASKVTELERTPKLLLFAKIGNLSGKKGNKKLQNSDSFQALIEDIRANYGTHAYTGNGRVSVLHHLQRMNMKDENILE